MDNKDKANQKRERIFGIIDEIVKMASDGECIYRGQPDIGYLQVSSTMYRTMVENCPEIRGVNWLDMNSVQKEELKAVRNFTSEDYDDEEILSRIQHYSGDTNLIDFTKDYRVALFFACNQKGGEEGGKDGKVFLLKTSKLKDSEIEIVTSAHPPNRVIAQKSIFIQSRTGTIPDNMMDFVPICLDLKQYILDYLKAYYGISEYTIYNDLHGYIKNRKAHGNSVRELYLGLNYGYKSENVQSPEDKSDALEKAMEYFDNAIRLTPDFAMVFYNRGIIKNALGDESGAISDYDKAINLDPNDAEAYNNRGVIKCELGDESGAISDYDKATTLDPNYAEAYNNRGVVKVKLGDKSGAINDYDKSIDLMPNKAEVYHNRGIVKLDLGDNKGAIKDLSIAIDLNSLLVQAYLNRGIAFVNLRNFQQALFDFEMGKKFALQQNEQNIADDAQKIIELITAEMNKS